MFTKNFVIAITSSILMGGLGSGDWTSLLALRPQDKPKSVPAMKVGGAKEDPVKPVYGDMCSRPGQPASAVTGDPNQWVGKRLPDVQMKSVDGRRTTGKDLKGKVVLFDFWATWCKPCLEASKDMQKLHDKYASQGLVVVGANTQEDGDAKGKVGKYVKEHGYSYLFTYGNDAFSKKLNVNWLPTMFIVDRTGKVRKVQLGRTKDLFERLEKEIRPLLAK